MKSVLGVSLGVLLTASAVSAGTVSYVPMVPDRDAGLAGYQMLPAGSASFQVAVESSILSAFDTVNLIIGSADGLGLSFVLDPGFIASTTISPPLPAEQFIYASFASPGSDVGVGGNRLDTSPPTPGFVPWTSPLLIGVLTVDTSSLDENSPIATVGVNSQLEVTELGSLFSFLSDKLGAKDEDFASGVSIDVVPEPATMLLLGLGGLVAVRRRLA